MWVFFIWWKSRLIGGLVVRMMWCGFLLSYFHTIRTGFLVYGTVQKIPSIASGCCIPPLRLAWSCMVALHFTPSFNARYRAACTVRGHAQWRHDKSSDLIYLDWYSEQYCSVSYHAVYAILNGRQWRWDYSKRSKMMGYIQITRFDKLIFIWDEQSGFPSKV